MQILSLSSATRVHGEADRRQVSWHARAGLLLALAGLGLPAAALVLPSADGGFDGPPGWTDEMPKLSRLLEQGYAAQAAGHPREAADSYCRAARLGHVDAQYRLGRLYADSPDAAQRVQGFTALGLAAQRGHLGAQQLLEALFQQGGGQPLPLGDPPTCQLTGDAAVLAVHEPPPPPAPPPPPEAVPHEVVERYVLALPEDKRRHARLIQLLAPRFSVDPRFALAIARAESNFDAQAVSPKNAQGLMQLIPDTAERFGVRNIRDPEQNVRGGLAYLKWLLARFDGNVELASAAYNAGEKAVERYNGIPPFAETQDYVKRILRFYRSSVHQPK